MKKNRNVFILAVILGLLTSYFIYDYLRKTEQAATRDYEEVITFAGDVTQKTLLKEEMLASVRIPKEAIHPQAVRTLDEAKGFITMTPMVKGEQVLKSKIARPGDPANGLAYTVPPGKRGITVGVDDVSGVAGFIKPGDHVDIVGLISINENNRDVPYSFLLHQDILVLACGKIMEDKQNEKEAAEYGTVTLAVTPEQSLSLVLTSQKGVIRLMLRSPVDGTTVRTVPVKPLNLIK